MTATTTGIQFRGKDPYGLARSIGDALTHEGAGNFIGVYQSFGDKGERVYLVSAGVTPVFHLNPLLAEVTERDEYVDVVLYTAPEIAQRVREKLG
ncbi:MAG: hypothetical protein HYY37_02130 [Candidatus Aenigmarchaeota archaeon]|nr:hypothetical protein [Candidatus Aenigmarchaeota archaeon]